MRIDLFEFLEGAIRGFVYFLYNLIETLWTVVRHPVRGPARLHRAYLRKGQQQIGALTLLFLFFFVYFGMRRGYAIGLWGNEFDTSRLPAILSGPPSLEGESAWEPLLAALVATIVVDAALRAFLRWRFPKRAERRRLVIATVEYALMWPLLLVLANAMHYAFDPNDSVLAPLSVIAFVIPARQFLAGVRKRSRGTQRKWLRIVRRSAEWTGAYVGILALASLAGSAADEAIGIVRAGRIDEPRLAPKALRCNLDREHPFVDIALSNPTRRAIMIEPYEDLVVVLASARHKFQIVVPTPTQPDPLPVLLGPNETQLVRLHVPKGTRNRPGILDICFVREASVKKVDVDWTTDDWKNDHYYVLEWDIDGGRDVED